MAINCGAVHEALLASELFRHEKAAFTGARAQRKGLVEAAEGAPLFLDEIGETSGVMQVKLLRVIEAGEPYPMGGAEPVRVDVRFLAATNRNLVEEGRSRRDLFYRLDVVELKLPPLAERRDDIPLLASRFLLRKSARLGRTLTGISPEAMALLTHYE